MRSVCPIWVSRFSTICLTRRDDVWCERVYSPWTGSGQDYEGEQQIPLFALESQDPVKRFDFLGITIQYEMCYTNILQILDSKSDSAAGSRPYHG